MNSELYARNKQNPIITLLLLVSLSIFAPALSYGQDLPTDDAAIANGKKLFSQNCMACHSAGSEVVVGPGLKGITERREVSWLIPWIKNSQAVIASGDEYGVALYEEYNKAVMTAFPTFKDEEILNILAYVNSYVEEKAEVVTDIDPKVPQTPGASEDTLNIIMVGFIIVMGLVLIVLILIISILAKFLNQNAEISEEDKAVVNQSFSLAPIFRSQAFIGAIIFIAVAVIGKSTIDGMLDVGIQQGYAPTQPIPFSHKIHAGEHEINCNYCHTGVYKGKSANIPSPNICSNCHNPQGIKYDSPKLTKLRDALENGNPIKWVRVHNLPDLAYFNHSQHTVVAGLECQQCHGPIEKREVVQQYSPLTMGWCINCHRETEVNTKGNEYYDNLVKLHSAENKEPMTVEDMGGIECSKCHY